MISPNREEAIMSRAEKQIQWQTRVDEHAQSGLSKTAFCRERNLSVGAFDYWQAKLASRKPEPAKRAGSFARVERADPESIGFAASLRLPGGASIEFRGYPDASWIKSVVVAFGSERP
jgi:hypothetical protein